MISPAQPILSLIVQRNQEDMLKFSLAEQIMMMISLSSTSISILNRQCCESRIQMFLHVPYQFRRNYVGLQVGWCWPQQGSSPCRLFISWFLSRKC